MPTIRVEFYGIPRMKAGLSAIEVQAETVGALLVAVGEAIPEFAAGCLYKNQLTADSLMCLNGTRFTRDTSLPLVAGDVLLILSADVGG